MSARYLEAKDQIKKKCVVCGKEFRCNNTTAIRTRIYCSEKCKRAATKERREERIELQKKAKNMSVSEISQLAKKMGMTYGQYIAKYLTEG